MPTRCSEEETIQSEFGSKIGILIIETVFVSILRLTEQSKKISGVEFNLYSSDFMQMLNLIQ